jgi:hypothetical protein
MIEIECAPWVSNGNPIARIVTIICPIEIGHYKLPRYIESYDGNVLRP